MQRRVRRAVAVPLAFLTCVVLAGAIRGAILPTAGDIPAAQALGAAQRDVVWLQGTINNSTITGSGTLIRGVDHDYALTAAHNISFTGGSFTSNQLIVGNGSSYINNIGQTTGVSTIYISPTFVPGNQSGLDYAFLRLNSRISTTSDIFTIAANPALGASILFSGYGIPGVMSGSSVTNTGNVMAFYANYSAAGPASWNSANDAGNFSNLTNSGFGSTRDSGGPVKTYNSTKGAWENLGHMTGAGTNFTIFFNYNNVDQAFRNYLSDVVKPATEAAQRPKLACAVIGTSAQLSLTTLETNREYRVMRSPILSGWQEAHGFTAISATYSWSEAVSPGGKMFYRLEWDE